MDQIDGAPRSNAAPDWFPPIKRTSPTKRKIQISGESLPAPALRGASNEENRSAAHLPSDPRRRPKAIEKSFSSNGSSTRFTRLILEVFYYLKVFRWIIVRLDCQTEGSTK